MRRALTVALASALACVVGTPAPAADYTPPPGDFAPVWSPDGSAIAYLGTRTRRGLRVIDRDGSADRVLPVALPSEAVLPSFAFSPDWFWVAFASGELVVSRPDGSERRVLAETTGLDVRPTWSPSGDRLAFPAARGLRVVRVDGSGLHTVTADGFDPAWSPSAELIAFVRAGPGRADLLVVRSDGSGERSLTAGLPPVVRRGDWSPDGTRIAYVSGEPDTLTRTLAVVSAEGRLVAHFAFDPGASLVRWSPDGRHLLVSGDGVFGVDVASGDTRLLAPFGDAASWSPDGRYVAFAGGAECRDRPGIYRLDVATGELVRLTNDCRIVGTPAADRLRGTGATDVLVGLGGRDTLTSVDAALVGDRLEGGPGDDTLIGSDEEDVLEGGAGRDALRASAGPDVLRGGAGADLLDGAGGRDQLYAEDGTRDVVRCGTNRVRGTGAELDVAFVDRVDAVDGRCELLYRDGRANLRAGRTALTITVVDPGEYRLATRTLRCNPSGGTLPEPAAACRRLATMRGPFAPVPDDRLCPHLTNRATALVAGTFAGRRITTGFSRATTCRREEWDRHSFLLRSH